MLKKGKIIKIVDDLPGDCFWAVGLKNVLLINGNKLNDLEEAYGTELDSYYSTDLPPRENLVSFPKRIWEEFTYKVRKQKGSEMK